MKNENKKAGSYWKSQGYALSGLKLIFKNERNFRIQIFFALLILSLSFLFRITHIEWIAVSMLISLVLITEAINSSIEALSDTLSQDFKVNIKYAKDVSAGCVLISALVSVLAGSVIFFPYLLKFFDTVLEKLI